MSTSASPIMEVLNISLIRFWSAFCVSTSAGSACCAQRKTDRDGRLSSRNFPLARYKNLNFKHTRLFFATTNPTRIVGLRFINDRACYIGTRYKFTVTRHVPLLSYILLLLFVRPCRYVYEFGSELYT